MKETYFFQRFGVPAHFSKGLNFVPHKIKIGLNLGTPGLPGEWTGSVTRVSACFQGLFSRFCWPGGQMVLLVLSPHDAGLSALVLSYLLLTRSHGLSVCPPGSQR